MVLTCEASLLKKDLAGKVILVTGGNGGIGLVCCRQFAKQGADVVLGCRNMAQGEQCAKDINKEVGSERVRAMYMDLSDLTTLGPFAADFKTKYQRLDVLLNNAGVMAIKERQLSKQGLEMQLGTNHIGHFVLTNLLLDVLKKSSPSRIVNVSSCYHDYAMNKEAFIDFEDINFEKRDYDPWTSYGQSKLANVLHAKELAKRLQGTGVTAVSLHPGWVRTNLFKHVFGGVTNFIMTPVMMMMGQINPWKGAQTSIFCSLDDSIPANNGAYFSQTGMYKRASQKCGWPMASPNPHTTDENAAKLWHLSEKIVANALKGAPATANAF